MSTTVNILYRETTTPNLPSASTAKQAPLTNREIDGNFKSIANAIEAITSNVTNVQSWIDQEGSYEPDPNTAYYDKPVSNFTGVLQHNSNEILDTDNWVEHLTSGTGSETVLTSSNWGTHLTSGSEVVLTSANYSSYTGSASVGGAGDDINAYYGDFQTLKLSNPGRLSFGATSGTLPMDLEESPILTGGLTVGDFKIEPVKSLLSTDLATTHIKLKGLNIMGFYKDSHSPSRFIITIGANAFAPIGTNYSDLGRTPQRWKDLYLINSPNVSSDERMKNIISPTEGIEFISKLNPIKYTMKVGENVDTITDEYEETGELELVFDEVQEKRQVEVFDTTKNTFVIKEETYTKKVPVYETYEILDEKGKVVKTEERQKVQPALKKKVETVSVEGTRIHYGLSAQQVKATMDDLGIEDFAGWCLEDKNDPDSAQSLRYEQFIPILIQAVKQQQEMIESLREEVSNLKG